MVFDVNVLPWKKKSIQSKLSDIYVFLIIGPYLIWPGLGGYARITSQKAPIFQLMTAAYLAASLLFFVELRLVDPNGIHEKKAPLRFNVCHYLIFSYLFFTLASALFSDFPDVAFWGGSRIEGFATLFLYAAGAVLVSVTADPKPWMLWTFAASILINDIISFLQLAGLNPFRMYPEGMTYYDAFVKYSGQFLGTLGNVDIWAAVLCIAIPVFLTAVIKMENKRKYLLLIPLIASVVALFMAFVAAGVVGICGGVLVILVNLINDRKKRRLAVCILILLAIAVLVLLYLFGTGLPSFLGEAAQVLHGNIDDTFGSSRIYIWRNTIKLVPEHLLLGGGPETLGLRTDAYFERYDENLGYTIHSVIDVAHNEYLNILVNQGLPALLSYFAMLVIAAIHWFRNARQDTVTAICGAGVLCYCIQAFFGISSPITAPFFWICLALLLGRYCADAEKKEERSVC